MKKNFTQAKVTVLPVCNEDVICTSIVPVGARTAGALKEENLNEDVWE